MEKKLTSNSSPFLRELKEYAEKKNIPARIQSNIEHFYLSYKSALEADGLSIAPYEDLFVTFLHLVKKEFDHPFTFQPFHERIKAPFDYYAFGQDFVRPLVNLRHSSITGKENIQEILSHIHKKHNVILLANHQTEGDPQLISLLLENSHPQLGEEMIFVAGERVITDPLAIPFSMGRNLLCIYSKRYIDHPPEQKMKKQLHNKRTMELMSELLSEGGKVIYVAPSGGRDRPNADGIVEIAPFDPQSIEMFYLMAKRAGKPTFFYPLALSTYELFPPPETIQRELGEARHTKRGNIHLGFGPCIDMEHFPESEIKDKHERRKARADYIWNMVKEDYSKFQ